jgi:hypothetical protein
MILVGISACKDHPQASPTLTTSAQRVVEQPKVRTLGNAQKKSCRDFVQGFYDWYVSPVKRDKQHPMGNLDVGDVLQIKPRLFSVKLLSLLKEDRDIQARNPGYITGLEFDPFLNSQDPSPKFQVQSVSLKDGVCRAVVWGLDDGKRREEVEPELTSKYGTWGFVNFHYPGTTRPSDENLIGQLNMLREERNHYEK